MGNDAFLDVDENDGNEVRYLPGGGIELVGPDYERHRKALVAENARRAKEGLEPLDFGGALSFLTSVGL